MAPGISRGWGASRKDGPGPGATVTGAPWAKLRQLLPCSNSEAKEVCDGKKGSDPLTKQPLVRADNQRAINAHPIPRRIWWVGSGYRALLGRKHHSVTAITEHMTGLVDEELLGNGEDSMKTLLAYVAFALAVAFTSQASALPSCSNSSWHGHYSACSSFDE